MWVIWKIWQPLRDLYGNGLAWRVQKQKNQVETKTNRRDFKKTISAAGVNF